MVLRDFLGEKKRWFALQSRAERGARRLGSHPSARGKRDRSATERCRALSRRGIDSRGDTGWRCSRSVLACLHPPGDCAKRAAHISGRKTDRSRAVTARAQFSRSAAMPPPSLLQPCCLFLDLPVFDPALFGLTTSCGRSVSNFQPEFSPPISKPWSGGRTLRITLLIPIDGHMTFGGAQRTLPARHGSLRQL
jgi:hypothetical protein